MDPTTNRILAPLPYHTALRDYFKTEERELWNWFSSTQSRLDYTETLRLELLKSTYRLDEQSHPDLYRAADEVKKRLGLDIPVTVYQAQQSNQLNATLFYIPGEAHIVFSGQILSLLDPAETKSVLGHELAHYRLWQQDDGDFLITDRITQSIATDVRGQPSHAQSARRWQLYTEIYADRGSFLAACDVAPAICTLVKISTGLQQVSAESYLRQADEIFSKTKIKTDQLSHPETFIRARSLSLWQDQKAGLEAQISSMIEGAATLDELDLLGQVRLTSLTRQFLDVLLAPKWFRTEAVMAHARLFFENFQPGVPDKAVLEEIKSFDTKLKEYFCYVLLDFVVADADLDQVPLAAALQLAEQTDMATLFSKIVTKELKIKARELTKLKEEAPQLLAAAEKA